MALYGGWMELHCILWYCIFACHSIVLYGIAWYCIVGFGARAVSRKTPIYFIINNFRFNLFLARWSWKRFVCDFILKFHSKSLIAPSVVVLQNKIFALDNLKRGGKVDQLLEYLDKSELFKFEALLKLDLCEEHFLHCRYFLKIGFNTIRLVRFPDWLESRLGNLTTIGPASPIYQDPIFPLSQDPLFNLAQRWKASIQNGASMQWMSLLFDTMNSRYSKSSFGRILPFVEKLLLSLSERVFLEEIDFYLKFVFIWNIFRDSAHTPPFLAKNLW